MQHNQHGGAHRSYGKDGAQEGPTRHGGVKPAAGYYQKHKNTHRGRNDHYGGHYSNSHKEKESYRSGEYYSSKSRKNEEGDYHRRSKDKSFSRTDREVTPLTQKKYQSSNNTTNFEVQTQVSSSLEEKQPVKVTASIKETQNQLRPAESRQKNLAGLVATEASQALAKVSQASIQPENHLPKTSALSQDKKFIPYLRPFTNKLYVPTVSSRNDFPVALDFRNLSASFNLLHKLSKQQALNQPISSFPSSSEGSKSQEATTMFVRVLQVMDAVYVKLSTPERLKLAEAFKTVKGNPELNQNEKEELWSIMNKQDVQDDLVTVEIEKQKAKQELAQQKENQAQKDLIAQEEKRTATGSSSIQENIDKSTLEVPVIGKEATVKITQLGAQKKKTGLQQQQIRQPTAPVLPNIESNSILGKRISRDEDPLESALSSKKRQKMSSTQPVTKRNQNRPTLDDWMTSSEQGSSSPSNTQEPIKPKAAPPAPVKQTIKEKQSIQSTQQSSLNQQAEKASHYRDLRTKFTKILWNPSTVPGTTPYNSQSSESQTKTGDNSEETQDNTPTFQSACAFAENLFAQQLHTIS